MSRALAISQEVLVTGRGQKMTKKPFKRRLSAENLKKLREAQRRKFHKEQAAKHGSKKRGDGEIEDGAKR